MKIYPFKASYPNLDLVASTDEFFSSVKLQYLDYKQNGFYKIARKPSLYVYEIIEDEYRHIGLLGCVDINDYSEGKILIHENTLLEKEEEFMDLLLERKSLIKPILLSHPPSVPLEEELLNFIEHNHSFIEVEFDSGNSKHKFWRINEDADIARISTIFSDQVKQAYISDGHHRSRATERLNKMVVEKKGGLKFDRIYCGFFGFNQLKIREFNRIISILTVVSPSLIMAKLSAICEIWPLKTTELPLKKHNLTMLLKNESYGLRWKKEVLDARKGELLLDSVLFNQLICNEICGIKDVRTDSRIKYVKGVGGIAEVERKTDYNEDVAFFLYPMDIDEFKYCSDNKILLPPKTTYFTPRMKNGIITHLF